MSKCKHEVKSTSKGEPSSCPHQKLNIVSVMRPLVAMQGLFFQHPHSSLGKAKLRCKVLGFQGWQCFGECVGDHVVCGAIHKFDGAIFDDPADKMEADVDVLCAHMILEVFVSVRPYQTLQT
jgi:hypothetical protein